MKNFEQEIKEIFDGNENHFEYKENEDNADIFDFAASVNPVYDGVRKVSGALGNIFGAKKKADIKNNTGFKNFVSSGGGDLPFYPTKEEMIKAAYSGMGGPDQPAAIQASYDPNSGTWNSGNWYFKVISTNPIAARAFKGAKETNVITSKINASVPYQAPVSMASPTKQSGYQATESWAPTKTQNQTGMIATSNEIANPQQYQPSGQPISSGQPVYQQPIAPTGGGLSGIMSGNTMWIVAGLFAAVIILVVVLKK